MTWKISRSETPKSAAGGKILRVVGSTDIDGQGTDFPVEDVGSLILFDDASSLVGPGLPPFGSHPHAGLLAVSCLLEGRWSAASNVPGAEDLVGDAGEVVFTHAGRGIVHSETTMADGSHAMVQVILRLPSEAARTPAAVWKRSVSVEDDGVTRWADPDDLREQGLDVALLSWSGSGAFSISLPVGHHEAFVYVRTGRVRLGDRSLDAPVMAVLSGEGELSGAAEQPSELWVGSSAVDSQSWSKLLGHNGFVVASTPEQARERLREFERDGDAFGR